MKTSPAFETLLAPLFLIAVGLGAAWLSLDYGIGTAQAPGTGYFPLLLGLLLAILASIVALRAWAARRETASPGPWPLRQLFVIIGGLVAFALLIGGLPGTAFPGAGLLPATFSLVFIAGRATSQLSLRGGLVLSVILAAVSWLVFVKALGLVVPLWPWSY